MAKLFLCLSDSFVKAKVNIFPHLFKC